MKIYELIKELNKKVTVKDTRVMSLKKHYLSMYRVYMVYLYDKGYISDPTVFNQKEILGNIVDLGINGMSSVSGKIELSEDYIGYALAKNKSDEEISEFLSLLLNAVKYRNMSMNIDKFYDDCGFSIEPKNKVSLGLAQAASRIVTKGGYDLNESILKCFKDTGYRFVSLNERIYETALNELGISNDTDDSIFVTGLTKEEEVMYSHLILNGLVRLDGKDSDKLVSWLKNNKWSDGNRFSSKNEGLYNWVVYIKSNDMIEEQAKLLNELIDGGYSIACMQSNGFYVECKDTHELPIGIFSVVGDDDDGEFLPEINKLEGYTGEVYSLDYLTNQGLSYVGCPIELYVSDKTKGYFIDKEQTELKDSISWFKYLNVNIDFGKSLYTEGVFPSGSNEDKLYKMLGDSESGKLVGYLDISEKELEAVKKSVIKKL